MAKTINELQEEIGAALSKLNSTYLPPELCALRHIAPASAMPRISLRHADSNRQIRRTADASCFDPSSCIVTVTYEAKQPEGSGTTNEVRGEVADIIVALNDAEHDAQFREFIGLKPFRDRYLPGRGYRWAQSRDGADRVLRQAIADRIVLRRQVPNPKSPEYPTTAVRLNTAHPTVQMVLQATRDERSPFHPVPIRGSSLSDTVIAERR